MANVAFGSRAFASSIYGPFRPNLCFDNNVNSFCHTRRGRNQYIGVRLKYPTVPLKVQVFNRQDCCWYRGKRLEVYAGNSRNWKKNTKCRGPANVLRYGLFICPAKSALYVHVVKKNRGYLNLGEIKVWGKNTYCTIIQTQCVKNRKYATTFRDRKFAPASPSDCKARAEYWHKWCQNDQSEPTGSRFSNGARRSRMTFWYPEGPGCWITQSSCLKFPSMVGTFRDTFGETHFKASYDQLNCIKRAKAIHRKCANAFTVTTKVEHKLSGAVKEFPGPGCYISQSACKSVPGYVGYFRDIAGEVEFDTGFNEASCYRRAKEYSMKICKNDASISTTAHFIKTRKSYTYPVPKGSNVDLNQYVDMAKEAAEHPIKQDITKHVTRVNDAHIPLTSDHNEVSKSNILAKEYTTIVSNKAKQAERASDVADQVWNIKAGDKEASLAREQYAMRRAARQYNGKIDREARGARLWSGVQTVQEGVMQNLQAHSELIKEIQDDHEKKLDDIESARREEEIKQERDHQAVLRKNERDRQFNTDHFNRKMSDRAEDLENEIRIQGQHRRDLMDAQAKQREYEMQELADRAVRAAKATDQQIKDFEFEDVVADDNRKREINKIFKQNAQMEEQRDSQLSDEAYEAAWTRDEQLRKLQREYEDHFAQSELKARKFDLKSDYIADKTKHEVDAATEMMDNDDTIKDLKYKLVDATHHVEHTRAMDEKEQPAWEGAQKIRDYTECVRCQVDSPNSKVKCCPRVSAHSSTPQYPVPPPFERQWPFQKLEPVSEFRREADNSWASPFINRGSYIPAEIKN